MILGEGMKVAQGEGPFNRGSCEKGTYSLPPKHPRYVCTHLLF